MPMTEWPHLVGFEFLFFCLKAVEALLDALENFIDALLLAVCIIQNVQRFLAPLVVDTIITQKEGGNKITMTTP